MPSSVKRRGCFASSMDVALLVLVLTSSFGLCHDTPVKLLWMASRRLAFGLFNASTNLGALAYSEGKLTELDIELSIHYRDSNCTSRNSIGEIFDVYQQSTFIPDLILGPICSDAMEPVALLASYLNRPILGWISSDPNLSDKSTFTTLVRTLWPIVNLANGVVQLSQLLHWRRVFIISSNNLDEDTLGAAVYSTIESNAYFTVTRYVNKVDLSPSIAAIEDIFTKVKKEARIVILSIPIAELRNWSLAAYNQKMHDGDYAFIYVNQQTATEEIYTKITNVSFYSIGDGNDGNVQQSLQNFFIVLAKTTSYNETNRFLRNFDYAAHNSNLSVELGVPPAPPDFYSLFMYDAVLVYSRFANLTNSINNGTMIFDAARNSVTQGGATGDIVLDSAGDRMPNYYFFKMGYNKAFDAVAQTKANILPNGGINWVIEELRPFIWGNGETGIENAPPDTPRCGFDNENCQLALYIATPVAIVAAILIGIGIYFIQRKLRYEKDLLDMAWRLNFNDIQKQVHAGMGHSQAAWSRDSEHILLSSMGGNPTDWFHMNFRAGSMMLRRSKTSVGAESIEGQAFINVGRYHGTLVALKFVRKSKVKLDRFLMEEMRKMMKLKHSNLNTFMGACTEAPNICCVWEYCSKGSLQDIIYNDSITLDDVFKFSICIDMFRGLNYLHDSHLKVHGRLKSNNVVVDGRWVCKLTDYGLDFLLDGQDEDPNLTEHNLYSQLYWTAPEELRPALRSLNRCRLSQLKCQAPSGDIYSAGVIVKEVFCRNGPYSEHETLTPDEVIAKVRAVPEEGSGFFRPLLVELPQSMESGDHVSHHLMAFIEELWAEDPKIRPGSQAALSAIIKINPFKSSNVVDNMIRLLEKYSNHLEEVVDARTSQLEEERKNTEQLLYRMLPRTIADKLKIGLDVEPESFDSVTLYFSDISGFQDLAAECSPFQVVDILNGVYGLFDGILPKHDVYKVETISDTYVMVSGLPQRNGDLHIAEIANCALDLISGALDFRVPHKPEHKLRMRIGINTGPIVASVVGLTMPRYCLFGDTINTTSRMESHGLPMRIHMSPSAKEALSKFAGYYLTERGTVTIKGKGAMTTFWLTGKVGYTAPLPDYEEEFQHDTPTPRRLPPTAGKSLDGKTTRPSIESGYSETISNPDVMMKDGVRISISPNLSAITPIDSDM